MKFSGAIFADPFADQADKERIIVAAASAAESHCVRQREELGVSLLTHVIILGQNKH